MPLQEATQPRAFMPRSKDEPAPFIQTHILAGIIGPAQQSFARSNGTSWRGSVTCINDLCIFPGQHIIAQHSLNCFIRYGWMRREFGRQTSLFVACRKEKCEKPEKPTFHRSTHMSFHRRDKPATTFPAATGVPLVRGSRLLTKTLFRALVLIAPPP
jgi:hypothetical protein